MLVNSNGLLQNALKEGYAIPAYNINNLEFTKFILEACNNDKSPVILEVTESSVKYFGGYDVVYNIVKSLINNLSIKVPVVLHLDHGKSFESCKSAIDAGFTSVMIDASSKSFEENIKITSDVVNYAKNHNVSVEAELGSIDKESDLTDVDSALEFVSITGINSLAPSIGNVHGIYTGNEKLDFERLGAICKNVKIPLVLHGASGLDDNKIKTAIFCGVSKININTDLQVAWTDELREFLDKDKKVYDPRIIIKSGEHKMKSMIHVKNTLFGSKNRAI